MHQAAVVTWKQVTRTKISGFHVIIHCNHYLVCSQKRVLFLCKTNLFFYKDEWLLIFVTTRQIAWCNNPNKKINKYRFWISTKYLCTTCFSRWTSPFFQADQSTLLFGMLRGNRRKGDSLFQFSFWIWRGRISPSWRSCLPWSGLVAPLLGCQVSPSLFCPPRWVYDC